MQTVVDLKCKDLKYLHFNIENSNNKFKMPCMLENNNFHFKTQPDKGNIANIVDPFLDSNEEMFQFVIIVCLALICIFLCVVECSGVCIFNKN
jgi:hypothetical protein